MPKIISHAVQTWDTGFGIDKRKQRCVCARMGITNFQVGFTPPRFHGIERKFKKYSEKTPDKSDKSNDIKGWHLMMASFGVLSKKPPLIGSLMLGSAFQ